MGPIGRSHHDRRRKYRDEPWVVRRYKRRMRWLAIFLCLFALLVVYLTFLAFNPESRPYFLREMLMQL